MSDVVKRAKAVLESITGGPWRWNDHRISDLMGRAGEPGVYEYDVEVLEAAHDGGCACRRSCELELTVSDADKAFIAAARSLVPELVAEVERLRKFSRCPRCVSTNTSSVLDEESPSIACHDCGYGT